MAVVRPFRVLTSVPEGDSRSGDTPATRWVPGRVEGLVLAPDEMGAVHRQLQRRHRVTKKADRVALALAGDAVAILLYPFRLRAAGGPGPGFPVYAASIEEAMERAEADLGSSAIAEACDDIEVLNGLEEEELFRVAQHIWGGEGKLSTFAIQHRRDNRRRGRPLRPMSNVARDQVVWGIRLAMLLPWFGPPETRHTGPLDCAEGHPKQLALHDLRRAEKIHGENIARDLIHDMHARFGARLVPYSAADARLLERFVGAYGYEAEGMRWSEIGALWEAGVESLRRAGLDKDLGRADCFRHGAVYRD